MFSSQLIATCRFNRICLAEYWLVDPQQAIVVVLTLVAGLYEEALFKGSDRIISPTFPNLELTAAQIL